MTPMTTEIALSAPLEALPEAPALPQAHSDDQLTDIWLHGRSVHTQRAYRADIVRFRRGAGKPLPSVTLTDLQSFADSLGELAAASRYRILSASSPCWPSATASDTCPSTSDGLSACPGCGTVSPSGFCRKSRSTAC